ncbi:MAG TPA: OsmC family protein [Ignavibacteria bacterium]|nr:OsmC family protein [Ignavibacteria bacterium]
MFMTEPANSVFIRNTQGYKIEIKCREHSLTADESMENGGTDTGPNPYELLLSSLGSCKAMTMRMYAHRKNIPLRNIIIRLSHNKIYAEDCENCETKVGKIDSIDVEIKLIGELTPEQRQSLLNISEKCPVHRTMMSEVKINSELIR